MTEKETELVLIKSQKKKKEESNKISFQTFHSKQSLDKQILLWRRFYLAKVTFVSGKLVHLACPDVGFDP